MKKRELILLNYGRAEPRKGIDLLLKSMKILKDQGIPVKAYIASPVSYFKRFDILDTYESLNLGVAVHFLHKVDNTQIDKLVKISDLFVMPSRDYETFGLTIIECLSRGLPVIGMPTGAIPEILSNVDKQLICDKVSANALAKKIEWFYRLSKKEKQKLSQKSLEAVKKHYSVEVVGKKLISFYESIT